MAFEIVKGAPCVRFRLVIMKSWGLDPPTAGRAGFWGGLLAVGKGTPAEDIVFISGRLYGYTVYGRKSTDDP